MQCLSIDRIDPKRKNRDWYYRQYDIFPAFLQNNVCTEIQLFCRFWFLLQALKMEQIKESLWSLQLLFIESNHISWLWSRRILESARAGQLIKGQQLKLFNPWRASLAGKSSVFFLNNLWSLVDKRINFWCFKKLQYDHWIDLPSNSFF